MAHTIGRSIQRSRRRAPLLHAERKTFSGPTWNLLMMGSLLATVPMLVLFLVFQRYFIAGISTGGVKR